VIGYSESDRPIAAVIGLAVPWEKLEYQPDPLDDYHFNRTTRARSGSNGFLCDAGTARASTPEAIQYYNIV